MGLTAVLGENASNVEGETPVEDVNAGPVSATVAAQTASPVDEIVKRFARRFSQASSPSSPSPTAAAFRPCTPQRCIYH